MFEEASRRLRVYSSTIESVILYGNMVSWRRRRWKGEEGRTVVDIKQLNMHWFS